MQQFTRVLMVFVEGIENQRLSSDQTFEQFDGDEFLMFSFHFALRTMRRSFFDN